MRQGEIDCAAFRERLSAGLDGALGGSEAQAAAAHAATCGDCRLEREAYSRFFSDLGPWLHQQVDRQSPERPFPAPPEELGAGTWTVPRIALLALAAAASLVLGIRLGDLSGRRTAPEQPAVASQIRPVHKDDCPWKSASPKDLHRAVSYPVVADECLDHQFELIEASVAHGRSCAENVRLTYRAGERRLVLEQHLDAAPTVCPHGESVLVGEIAGCFERLARGVGQLRWSHRNRAFELTGDVAAADAVLVARNIAASVED